MQLVEKTIIRRGHPFYKGLDYLSFLSKNLYNAANYVMRQEFFASKKLTSAFTLCGIFKTQPDYISLLRQVSQQIIIQVAHDWKSFFAAIKEWRKHPEKFKEKPEIPGYKHKTNGRNLLTYTNQSISRSSIKNGHIKLLQTAILIPTKLRHYTEVDQVRISRKSNSYEIHVVYTVPDVEPKTEGITAALDLGINNLAAITFSNGSQPIIVNGKPLKSINQFYNKQIATAQSHIAKEKRKTSRRTEKLAFKRNNKVLDYLHKASRYITNQLVSKGVKLLIIGYNPDWKQEVNIGSVNNQNFVCIPFLTFIRQLKYKCKLVGITVELHEESYTSKCSFLDQEAIEKHEQYAGRRVKRGMFKAANGRKINADINGSYNIMRKAAANEISFDLNAVEGIVICPTSVSL